MEHTYTIRPGDTLASIAKDHYGDYRLWQRIYNANKHLLADPTKVEVGQKIVLP
jgi:nucleoid-associated protein YgaU